jgi:hypothetical protein
MRAEPQMTKPRKTALPPMPWNDLEGQLDKAGTFHAQVARNVYDTLYTARSIAVEQFSDGKKPPPHALVLAIYDRLVAELAKLEAEDRAEHG